MHCINRANITLIPKKGLANSIGDYRPISLIHSLAKLMSKVLALQLAKQLDSLVSNAQSAFIKGRCIQDNFLCVRNVVRKLHATKKPSLFFKLDITKSFDSVSWEYLLEQLQEMGFSDRWRDWISLLLATSTSRIFLNGSLEQSIQHQRGLRQGDPLSPYLFILAIDPLQKILDVATSEGILTKVASRAVKFRTSLYADDAAVFINPARQEVQNFLQILENFGAATGLQVNTTKSSLTPICCSDQDLLEVMAIFDDQQGDFPLTYLGLPLMPGKLKHVHLQPAMDKIKARMGGWKSKLVYQSGRKVLVKTVLSAMPTYLLTVLKPPKGFLNDIDKTRRKFLWAGDQDALGGKSKVNWQQVCSPIDCGGLGIPCLEKFSRSLRLRWLWYEWTNPEKPWIGTPPPCDDTDRTLFAAATRVTLGDGRKAILWESNWIGGQPLKSIALNLFKHSK